ncbi:MAG TPA: hypothetical protein VF680_17315 [Allosphingosinicella sp.]|jgi:hypothetical protein
MRPLVECDTECYPDYWLCKLYDSATNQYASYGMWPGQPLDIQGLTDTLSRVTIVTFNGNHYDMQMITLALYGADTAQLKEANDDIIVRNVQPWDFYKKWGIEPLAFIDHIDIMEVSPGVRISLKMYMGRLHAPKLQDLPYDPSTALDATARFVIADYCGNDLVGTWLLRKEIWERIQLRIAIGERYNIDVRSKSDAQIAEAVIKAQLDFKPAKRYIPDKFTFGYTPPGYIRYVSPQLQQLLADVQVARFIVRDKEEAVALGYHDPEDENAPKIRTGVHIPEALSGRDIIIGNGKYRLGIGGLHSTEKCRHYIADDTFTIRDIDVKSYYPSLILTMGMVPEQLGEAFSRIYRGIYDRRLSSKAESARIGDLYKAMGAAELLEESKRLGTESDGLKIVLNGTFGKLFSKWSVLFAPELGIRTTLTGQLALLMLIEMMEASGIEVLSANTDGIVLKIPRGFDMIADQIVKWWERQTGLEMEATTYSSIWQRDVNNYIAIGTDGKVKRKGAFGQSGVLAGPQGKGPNMDICADAVVAYLKDGKPIDETIKQCRDIRKFIVLRGVTGGGTFIDKDGNEGAWLGKAVRWYYSAWQGGHIVNKHGHKVATSDGAMPCMDLPLAFPSDIDYQKYENNAMEMLATLGVPVRYWHHDETDTLIVGHAHEDWSYCVSPHSVCIEISRNQYRKRK